MENTDHLFDFNDTDHINQTDIGTQILNGEINIDKVFFEFQYMNSNEMKISSSFIATKSDLSSFLILCIVRRLAYERGWMIFTGMFIPFDTDRESIL